MLRYLQRRAVLCAYRVVSVLLVLAVTAGLLTVPPQLAFAAGGEIPEQEQGSAAGLPHSVPAEATSPGGDSGGVPHNAPPAKGLAPDTRHPVSGLPQQEVERTEVEVGVAPPAEPEGFDPATSRELVERRSSHRQVFDNADGTETVRVYQSRRFTQQDDGSWAPIDSSLVSAGDVWRTRSDAENKQFAAVSDADQVVTIPAGQPSHLHHADRPHHAIHPCVGAGRLHALNRLVAADGGRVAYAGRSLDVAAGGASLYSYLPGGEPLGVTTAGTSGVAVANQHTDLVGVVDPTTGGLSGWRTFTPLGSQIEAQGVQPGLGFQRQYTDPDTGRVNMGSRWYQPGTGTFASRDQAALDPRDIGNANRYTYAGSSPLNHTDPTGQWVPVAVAVAYGVWRLAPVISRVVQVGRVVGTVASWFAGSAATSNTFGGRSFPAPRYLPGQPRYHSPNLSRFLKYNTGSSGKTGRGKISGGVRAGSRWVSGGSAAARAAALAAAEAARQAARAQRVRMDALTPHARPPLTQTIAPNIQAQIDAARTATPIELGVLGSAADEPFIPDELTAAGGPAPLPPQARAIYSGDGCEITETWSSSDGYNHNRSLLYDGCGSGGGGAGSTPLLEAGALGTGTQGVESCEPNSFVPGTRVLMADGSTKPIEEVRGGEEVLATDPVTGEMTSRRVVATIAGEGQKDLVEITVDTDGPAGDETGVLVATDGHPFWVPEQHRWVKAGELVAGDQLQGPDGTQLQVVSTKTWTALQRVHNLTVDGIHTYHVLAGQTPVLVHNSNGICGSADPFSFKRTEALSGNASKRNVDSLTASMKESGWQGDPISVAKIGDDLYVLDGHHRVAAAKRAGIDVSYRILSDAEIRARYPGGADDITTAWAEVGPDRLVNKYRKPGYR
ncbi:polymorphic toxin-type HINT domain-containing protein [Saccharopolyspora sp. NPDC050389]|uniref:polymorphic toxin-type HINT domain-containing protein n=1 Tax=Saccharopolyspora sp. NPDC050389 TaxID=3155516 RepID=UPI0034014ABA